MHIIFFTRYTFDKDEEGAEITYDLVTQAYNTLFTKMNMPYLVVNADAGMIGGSKSHEYVMAYAVSSASTAITRMITTFL